MEPSVTPARLPRAVRTPQVSAMRRSMGRMRPSKRVDNSSASHTANRSRRRPSGSSSISRGASLARLMRRPELRNGDAAKNSARLPLRFVFRSHSSTETRTATLRPLRVMVWGPCERTRSITSLKRALAAATGQASGCLAGAAGFVVVMLVTMVIICGSPGCVNLWIRDRQFPGLTHQILTKAVVRLLVDEAEAGFQINSPGGVENTVCPEGYADRKSTRL